MSGGGGTDAVTYVRRETSFVVAHRGLDCAVTLEGGHWAWTSPVTHALRRVPDVAARDGKLTGARIAEAIVRLELGAAAEAAALEARAVELRARCRDAVDDLWVDHTRGTAEEAMTRGAAARARGELIVLNSGNLTRLGVERG